MCARSLAFHDLREAGEVPPGGLEHLGVVRAQQHLGCSVRSSRLDVDGGHFSSYHPQLPAYNCIALCKILVPKTLKRIVHNGRDLFLDIHIRL